MKNSILRTLAAAIACAFVAVPAHALTINDPGVVGTIDSGTQNADVDNVREWANYLLGLSASVTTTADGNIPTDGQTEDYATSSTNYNGTLTGGVRVNGGTIAGSSSYEYVLAKYDGQNAGYVLFYVPDLVGSIPLYPADLWTTNPTQYALSNYTGFGSFTPPPPPPPPVPDGGATLMLLGMALAGLGTARKFVN